MPEWLLRQGASLLFLAILVAVAGYHLRAWWRRRCRRHPPTIPPFADETMVLVLVGDEGVIQDLSIIFPSGEVWQQEFILFCDDEWRQRLAQSCRDRLFSNLHVEARPFRTLVIEARARGAVRLLVDPFTDDAAVIRLDRC